MNWLLSGSLNHASMRTSGSTSVVSESLLLLRNIDWECGESIRQQYNLPLQANPSLGGMLTNNVVEHVQSILPNAMHVYLETARHALGLYTWEVSSFLRAVTSF